MLGCVGVWCSAGFGCPVGAELGQVGPGRETDKASLRACARLLATTSQRDIGRGGVGDRLRGNGCKEMGRDCWVAMDARDGGARNKANAAVTRMN